VNYNSEPANVDGVTVTGGTYEIVRK
jgi:hypothetical protein